LLPYTDGYFRSLLYDISQILIVSDLLISTLQKKDTKKRSLQKNMDECCCVIGSVKLAYI